MFKFDTNIYIYIYINFKCVIVSWSSVTGSHYSTEFSVQNGGSKSHVMGTTVAMNRTQKKKLLNELKKIRVNFSTKFNYIFPPKSNLFEMSCCNLVV